MTAALLSSLDKLPERILKAKERSATATADEWKLSTLTHMAFSQVIQLKDSEKTVSGVIGTAQRIFSRFLVRELIATLCGKTTIPLDMEGKKASYYRYGSDYGAMRCRHCWRLFFKWW